MTRGAVLVLFLAASLLTGETRARERDSWPLDEGWAAARTRVRVTAPEVSPDRTIGWVRAWTADTLVVDAEPDREVVSFSRSEVVRIETSKGVKGHAVRGAIAGLLVGAVIGLSVGGGMLYEDGSSDTPFLVAAGITAGSTLLGGILGSLHTSERWKEAYER